VPFLPHAPRNLHGLAGESYGPHRSPRHFEHVFRIPVQAVLFLFALVNAGVLLQSFGTGTWAVLLGSLVGRPIGVLAGVGVAVAAGFHLPHRVGWKELIVMAMAISTGFTFALFFATAVYPVGSVLGEVKVGALATAAGFLLTLGAAALLHVDRGANHRRAAQGAGDPDVV
jgi:NhaA family Na+:H+ antiporter